MPATQRIITNLWFDHGQVEDAAMFYLSVFQHARIGSVARAGNAGTEITGIPPGDALSVELELEGHKFVGINGGPQFKFNPSVSFLVACNTSNEVDQIWEKLSPGGIPLMDIGKYPFSQRYGWIRDKYGVSWQVMMMDRFTSTQKIVPTLMFTGHQAGNAEIAIKYYTGIFHKAHTGEIMRYQHGEEPDKEGTIKHAGFNLEGQEFAAMDSAYPHDFNFNEAVSFMVTCNTQKEIDYYWGHLTAGGEEGPCGWLKDRFGLSWQVTPGILGKMLSDPDRTKADRVTAVFLKMKKFDIAALKRAYNGEVLPEGNS